MKKFIALFFLLLSCRSIEEQTIGYDEIVAAAWELFVAGNYYDAYGNVQTMDYSYEIMKYDLTNAEFVEYVYSNNILDEGWGEDIGWCFDAIS